jgi:FkbM family methyltransferase
MPECEVHAFEPVSNSYELCKETKLSLPLDHQKRISIWPLAIGDHDGIIDFFEIDASKGDDNQGAASRFEFLPGMNGSFYGKNWVQKKVIAEIRKLDSWAEQHGIGPIDMIWIDVQGGELQAFQGAEKTLESVKIIFSEVGLQEYYKGQSLKPDIDRFLSDRGFQEVTEAFELNGFAYEGNTVYVRKT